MPTPLAKAIERLFLDEKLRQRLSARAKSKMGSFSWDLIARQHLELIAQVREAMA
jgi:glycosyltransferase involved in cell wall biosynthesis